MALGAALFGGVIAFAAQGCSDSTSNEPQDGGPDQDTGSAFDSGNPPDAGLDGDTGSAPGDPCLECLYQQCYVQYATCVQDNACYQAYVCAVSCTTSDCIDNCLNQHPQAAQDKYIALAQCDTYNACAASTCKATCQNENPGCTPGDDGGTTQSCAECTDQFCSTQKANCASGSDCEQYQQCTLPCADDANPEQCIQLCQAAHAKGAQDSEALSTCTTSSCSTPCGF